MSILYLAINYACNHHCLICPHRKKEDRQLSLAQVECIISAAIKNRGIKRVVLSGGEPVMHPEFFEICAYLAKNGLYIKVLTNGTYLASDEMLRKLYRFVPAESVTFTVSLHSHLEETNDYLAGRQGSYRQTLAAILKLNQLGYRVQIKHCVNKVNYLHLTEYLLWAEKELPVSIPINICNIDYCGMTEEKLRICAVSLTKVGRQLARALRKMSGAGAHRQIFISDTPLCTLPRRFWKYTEYEKTLGAYADPKVSRNGEYKQTVKSDVEASFPQCRRCRLHSVCHGTWEATIAYWGSAGIPKICINRSRGIGL